jgi:hypothetical protein
MFYYTFNKPISHLSLPFFLSAKLISPSTCSFSIFCFFYSPFFCDNTFCTNSIYCMQTTILVMSIYKSVYNTQILVLPHHVFTPQNVAPLLRVHNCIFLLTQLCQQFHHTVLCMSCYIWTDGQDNANRCSSAGLQCRCGKQLMKLLLN